MNRNGNIGVWIALAVVGALMMMLVVAGGVGYLAYRYVGKKSDESDRARQALISSSQYTYSTTTSPTFSWSTTTATSTPTITLYGGIAYSGSGGYQTRIGEVDGYKAKADAVAACNQAIWAKGWGADSYCGYVPLKTGECGSVATAPAASGWGPTGWASGAFSRSRVRQAAIDKCDSVGQGKCHELITLCM